MEDVGDYLEYGWEQVRPELNPEIGNELLGYLLITVPLAIGFILLVWGITALIYPKDKPYGQKIHRVFLRKAFRIGAVWGALCFVIFGYQAQHGIGKAVSTSILSLLGVGFIAQEVLKDVLAGFMISVYRPFDLGDRIRVHDVPGACIVEDLTLRHIVLRSMDGICYIIPNSQMNKKTILNTSFGQEVRGTYISIAIECDNDVGRAIELMRKAARESPYTCPGSFSNGDLNGYGDVYLEKVENGAVVLKTTIWTEKETDNGFAVSEVYQEIVRTFNENGIRIFRPGYVVGK